MSWEGKLLVATPLLVDDSFARSVVQLLHHSAPDGALGVVLTSPSDVPVAATRPGWALLSPDPCTVFTGGPVQPSTEICLARLAPRPRPEESYAPVDGAPWLATVDLDAEPADALQEVRVFTGYAGWSPGQLEAEVEQGAWWVLEALPGDCFTQVPERLWSQVLRRQAPPLAFAALLPRDPGLN